MGGWLGGFLPEILAEFLPKFWQNYWVAGSVNFELSTFYAKYPELRLMAFFTSLSQKIWRNRCQNGGRTD